MIICANGRYYTRNNRIQTYCELLDIVIDDGYQLRSTTVYLARRERQLYLVQVPSRCNLRGSHHAELQ